MNEMLYPASAFVVTAVIGWGMYVRGSHRTGNALLALSLVGLWCLAVLHRETVSQPKHPAFISTQPELQTSTVEHRTSNIEVPISKVDLQIPKFKGPYVGSTINHRLHAVECHYVRRMRHGLDEIPNVDAGVVAGFIPCTDCIKDHGE